LPEKLPAELKVLWENELTGAGLGGIAANESYVIFGDRDLGNLQDVFHCLDAETGLSLWTVEYPAIGELDYGETPRSTPLIHGDHVYLTGAFGDVHCVRLIDGKIVWKKNFGLDFLSEAELAWGFCGSPLIADGKLIVAPGAKEAALVALDPQTGKVLWQTSGSAPGYGSLIVGEFGGVKQIVGHDLKTLGGWDLATGRRLWTVKPHAEGDFNVPTPLQIGKHLLVMTENNGARMFEFAEGGKINADPIAENRRVNPDMSSPVQVGNRVFLLKKLLYCLTLSDNAEENLAELWKTRDASFSEYGALMATDDRLLAIADGGVLLLLDPKAKEPTILSRLQVFEEDVEVYSHPALVGDRLYIRGETGLKCVSLASE